MTGATPCSYLVIVYVREPYGRVPTEYRRVYKRLAYAKKYAERKNHTRHIVEWYYVPDKHVWFMDVGDISASIKEVFNDR